MSQIVVVNDPPQIIQVTESLATAQTIVLENRGPQGAPGPGAQAPFLLVSYTPNTVPLTIKGLAAQTSNLLEFRDSTNALLGYVDPTGSAHFNDLAIDDIVLDAVNATSVDAGSYKQGGVPLAVVFNGRGLFSDRPPATAVNEGYLYYATDQQALYRSLGGSWEQWSQGPHAPSHLPAGADPIDWSGTVHKRGTAAARPAATPANAGLFYYAYDAQIMYRSTGADWEAVGGAGAATWTQAIGNGAATQIDVQHGLATDNVYITVKEGAAPNRIVYPEVQVLSVSTVRLLFDVAPTLNQYQVTIIGGSTSPTLRPVSAYGAVVGNGVLTSIPINHNLGTTNVVTQVRETATGAVVEPDIVVTDQNTVTLGFSVAPAAGSISATVLAAAGITGAASQHAAQHKAGGSDALSQIAINNQQVRDIGATQGDYRAGRVWTKADFDAINVTLIAAYNMSDLTDFSGNGRTLTNKGGVPFTSTGIMGTNTVASFNGTQTQFLYWVDTGISDPFRFRTGTIGVWFKAEKRSTTAQYLISRSGPASGAFGWFLNLVVGNTLQWAPYNSAGSGALGAMTGTTDVVDGRWHFAAVTIDATKARLYIDANLDTAGNNTGEPYTGAAPVNFSGYGGDASLNTVATSPFYGRMDEVFFSSDVLSEEQIRYLYACKVPHGLGQTPGSVSVNVKRRKRGAVTTPADYPAGSVRRLYNFTNSTWISEGLDTGATLVPQPGTGVIASVSGADGSSGGAYHFSGTHQGTLATDAGLPMGTVERTLGVWYKTTAAGTMALMRYGASPYVCMLVNAGNLLLGDHVTNHIVESVVSNDGQWHQGVAVIDPNAFDGVKMKLYRNGRLVGGTTNLIAGTAPGGALMLNVAVLGGTTYLYTGELDGLFILDKALTAEQVRYLYALGSQALLASPKNPGYHIEGMDNTYIYTVFDSIDPQDLVEVRVQA